MPDFVHALATYYLILPAEASQQPGEVRRDALRPAGAARGHRRAVAPRRSCGPPATPGFGDEVKRRIILGTYALSSGYYDAYYGQAQKVRTLVSRDFAAAFEQADVLVSPTAPTTAFRLGEKLDDPLAMYLNDLATIPANLAGVPGISVPSGLADEDGLPTGVQVLAPAIADDRVYRVGAALEAAADRPVGRPAARPGARPAWASRMTHDGRPAAPSTRPSRRFDPALGPRGARRAQHRAPRCSAAARRCSAPSPTRRSARSASGCPARCRSSTPWRSSPRSASGWR